LHQSRYGLSRYTLEVDGHCNIDALCIALSERSMTEVEGERPLVEILYFDGCPNHEAARELVRRVSAELGLEPELRLVNIPDEEVARRLRFLGSPTIRVNGRDVDPQTWGRDDYRLSCRVYRTDRGLTGQPEERWIREALLREQGGSDADTDRP
jgi:hypothetical protein